MIVKPLANVRIYDDSALRDVLFALDPDLAEVELSAFTQFASGRIEIAAAGTESIPFGDVASIRGLFIKADAGFNLTLVCPVIPVPGGSPPSPNTCGPLPITPGATGGTARILAEVQAQSGTIQNYGTGVLHVVYCVWG